jgi:formylmethanofuran dehydrogenase subunit B
MTHAPSDRLERHVTCLGCGCCCDDLEVTVRGERIAGMDRACDLGAAWLRDGRAPAHAKMSGAHAPREESLAVLARMLASARRPLVYLAADVTCEAKKAAVALADRLGAALDNLSSSTVAPSLLAAQEIGRATATLGEIRNRADVLVFWDVDAARYPRFADRYAPRPDALYVPAGRQGRRIVSVTVEGEAWRDADRVVRLASADETPTLTLWSALLADQSRARGTGPAWEHAATLLEAVTGGRYVAVIVDAEPAGERAAPRAEALCRLSHALNHEMRGAVLALRAGGNRSGAEAVMTASAGYPMSVDFSDGTPRYRPHDGSARALLTARAVDAVLIVGDGASIDAGSLAALADTPCAVIGPAATTGPLAAARIAIDSARAGVHEAGTALRMDDVPIPLRSLLPGPPPTVELLTTLQGLLGDVRSTRAVGPRA